MAPLVDCHLFRYPIYLPQPLPQTKSWHRMAEQPQAVERQEQSQPVELAGQSPL
jgi:hypothetical protein